MAAISKAELERIRQLQSRAMRAAVIGSFTNIRNDALLAEIVAQLDAGNIEGALQVINYNRAQFAQMEQAIINAYTVGGTTVATQVGRINLDRTGPSVVFNFNVRAPRAEQWISEHSSNLIVEIIEDQRNMARNVMRAGLEAGRNPRNVALDLVGRIDSVTKRRQGGFIGLTDQQAQYVLNARRELESGDPSQMANYFSRERRDRRFDSLVRRAMDEGKPVNSSDIDKITSRYNDRLLELRGETIARTESINALRQGQQESIRQAVEQADVLPSEVTKTWQDTGDGRTRETHRHADGQTVPFDQPYIVGGYRMMHPGDSSLGAPASETIACRCTSSVTLDWIGRALRISGF